MQYVDQYQTLAQIAIGLAGFSGIIITLQKKPANEYAAIRRARSARTLLRRLESHTVSLLQQRYCRGQTWTRGSQGAGGGS